MKDYKYNQLEKYKSHEIDVPKWYIGQERFINNWMVDYPKNFKILDISCGDGVGLRVFKKCGFECVEGFEWSYEKAEIAKQYGYPIHVGDMHDLVRFKDSSFDIVYSSHTLEHAHTPIKVLDEFKRILKVGGDLILVLPFPDKGPDDAHCGKFDLGTDSIRGKYTLYKLLSWCQNIKIQEDDFREPEIWIKATKI